MYRSKDKVCVRCKPGCGHVTPLCAVGVLLRAGFRLPGLRVGSRVRGEENRHDALRARGAASLDHVQAVLNFKGRFLSSFFISCQCRAAERSRLL